MVWTNGCFDLLHAGHARSLAGAKALGDILIVGINSDESVRALKGPGRPIMNEPDRAELLAALEAVDYVTVFPEPDPIRALSLIQPDNFHLVRARNMPMGQGRCRSAIQCSPTAAK